jgi:nucleoid DNA-binding protein
MSYDELVTLLAHRTGLHSDAVKRVMVHLPEALQELPPGGDVRTPLGVFRKVQRRSRDILLPDGTTRAKVTGQTLVKLRPGSKMRTGDFKEDPNSFMDN